MRTFVKDPQETLDYDFLWSDTLVTSETISTSSITVDAGLTKNSESNTTTTAKVWVSGGTLGETYKVVNTITTNQGRTYQRTFQIKLSDR